MKHPKTRSLATLLIAGVLSLALVAGAGAAIYVYGTGFGSKKEFRDLERSGGGNKCEKRHMAKAKAMRVILSGKRLCEFSPPFVGDASQPNHIVLAKGQVLPRKTPKALRDAAYLAVKVRAGKGGSYELTVRPRGKIFRLLRNHNGTQVIERGQSGEIKALRKMNTLRLEAKGARVSAYVNGAQVGSTFVDPNPDQVPGRKVSFGIGNSKDSDRETVGVFDRIRAGIAN